MASMEELPSDIHSVFNCSVAAFAISALWDLGILDHLAAHETLELQTLCDQMSLYEPAIRSLCDAAALIGVVHVDQDTVSRGTTFTTFHLNQGFFGWLIQGSGGLLIRAGQAARSAGMAGSSSRDFAAIALAAGDVGRRFVDPVVFELLDEIQPTCLVDLGCGNGSRLIDLVGRYPHLSTVGFEIDPAVVQTATNLVEGARLEDRVQINVGDVRRLEPSPEYLAIDTVTCFFLGHDFWPAVECINTLELIRKTFPNAKTFLLGDTYVQTPDSPDRVPPVFVAGFNLVHSLLRKTVPSREDWHSVFPLSGWRCLRVVDLDFVPSSSIFVLTPIEA